MAPVKIWVANGPEDRLSIAAFRFLNDTLESPFYVTMIHDRDHGKRTLMQRSRDANRGVTKGQLDADVVQGPPYLHRKLELKRGRNDLTEAQIMTVDALTQCGGPPVVAWDLRDVFSGLMDEGFRFVPNSHLRLAYYEELLASWDREAELKKSPDSVLAQFSRSKPREPKPTRAQLNAVARARAKGVLV